MGQLMNMSDMEAQKTISNFDFSGTRVEKLGASEYTLATVAIDISSSVRSFKDDLEASLKSIVEACRKHPKSENVLVRVLKFNSYTNEIHGFTELTNITDATYDGEITPSGATALCDGASDSLEALQSYANQLDSMDYLVNGVLYVVTDGGENASTFSTPDKVKRTIEDIRKEEKLESLQTFLIGIGPEISEYVNSWESFKNDAGFDELIKMGEATAQSLAKLANFISRSISSSSEALGTGGPSQPLTF